MGPTIGGFVKHSWEPSALTGSDVPARSGGRISMPSRPPGRHWCYEYIFRNTQDEKKYRRPIRPPDIHQPGGNGTPMAAVDAHNGSRRFVALPHAPGTGFRRIGFRGSPGRRVRPLSRLRHRASPEATFPGKLRSEPLQTFWHATFFIFITHSRDLSRTTFWRGETILDRTGRIPLHSSCLARRRSRRALRIEHHPREGPWQKSTLFSS